MRIATDGPLTPAAAALLNRAQVTLCTIGKDVTWPTLTHDVDALIYSGREPLPPEIYRERDQLQVIALTESDDSPVDMEAATRAGITVLEPARGESASVADFAMYRILQAARERDGGAIELYGKTIGLLGFGPTATAVAQRAKGFGMRILVWDESLSRGRTLLYDAEPKDLVDLLVTADFVVNLLPLSEQNRHRFGKDELQLLRKDATWIHLADPALLKWDELVRALDWGYVRHFAIDLPPGRDDLADELRPYIGEAASVNKAADTIEARQAIYLEMAGDVICVLRGEAVETAVNLPILRAIDRRKHAPWFDLAEVLGAMLGARIDKRPAQVDLVCGGEAAEVSRDALARAFCAGLAGSLGETTVNRVSGALWAKEAKIELRWRTAADGVDALTCQAGSRRGKCTIGGTIRHMRLQITRLDDYVLTAEPTEHLLLVPHANRPGMVGQVGTLLGGRHVNIRGMVLGQKAEARDTAVMWIMLDQAPEDDLIERLAECPGILHPEYIHIPMVASRRRK